MQITSKDICNIFDPKFNILGFQSLFTPQDYITKGKTIKNLNIKKCDKNYCTHSRIRIALPGINGQRILQFPISRGSAHAKHHMFDYCMQ